MAVGTAAAKEVRVTERELTVALVDRRVVSVPLSWYPRLAEASPRERRAWVLVGSGAGIHWPGIDEDISVEALLGGLPSGESAASFRRWRASRNRPARRMEPTRSGSPERAAHS